MATEENRKKALVAALGQIEKQFGKGSVMRLGDAGATYDVETVSTGSLGLDIALGVGGLPKGRVVEIYGPESSGKTTLALTAIAEVQRHGRVRRCRARARPGLRREAGRQRDRVAGLAARQR
jgi:recombination protein RecA